MYATVFIVSTGGYLNKSRSVTSLTSETQGTQRYNFVQYSL